MLDDFAHFVHVVERVGSEHVLEFNDAVLCEWEIAQEVVCELLLGVAAISFEDVLTLPHVIIDVVGVEVLCGSHADGKDKQQRGGEDFVHVFGVLGFLWW